VLTTARVLALEDFERFVYVLSILERYSERDCAVMLGISIQELREVRVQAQQHIADMDRRDVEEADSSANDVS